jgi:hypothetical protein
MIQASLGFARRDLCKFSNTFDNMTLSNGL